MKLFLVLVQFLCVSFLCAADDIWDFKIGVGDKFQNSKRSIYLQCSEYNGISIENIHNVMITFDIKNKDTNTKIASIAAHYYGTQDSSIRFGIIGKFINTDQIDESIQTAMGIFRAKNRLNLLFDRFEFGIIDFMEPDGLKSFCNEKFTFLKSCECPPIQLFHIAKR